MPISNAASAPGIRRRRWPAASIVLLQSCMSAARPRPLLHREGWYQAGIVTAALSIVLGTIVFAVRAGSAPTQAFSLLILTIANSTIVLFLSYLTLRDRRVVAQLLATAQQTREQAEATNVRLRESEERFRLITEEAPIGKALVALDGRFL